MTYNKSEIMKAAWNTFRSKQSAKLRKNANINTFADALRFEWSIAKSRVAHAARIASGLGWYNASELSTGDTIVVDTVGVGITAKKVIATIAPAPLGFAGKAVSFTDGSNKVFTNLCTINRVAVAA